MKRALQIALCTAGAVIALAAFESEQPDHELNFDLALDHWPPMVAEYVAWRPNPQTQGLQFADFPAPRHSLADPDRAGAEPLETEHTSIA